MTTPRTTYRWGTYRDYTLAGGYEAQLSLEERNAYVEWVLSCGWWHGYVTQRIVVDAMRIGLRATTYRDVLAAVDDLMNMETAAYHHCKAWYEELVAAREKRDAEAKASEANDIPHRPNI